MVTLISAYHINFPVVALKLQNLNKPYLISLKKLKGLVCCVSNLHMSNMFMTQDSATVSIVALESL